MKTARYRKKCFNQIEGIAASNKELTTEVERLRQRLEAVNHEKMVQESQNQNLVIQLSNKEREKQVSSHLITTTTDKCCCVIGSNSCSAGLEAEVIRLREEKSHVIGECDRLNENNRKLAQDQSWLRDHTTKMTEELKGKLSNRLCSFLLPP